MSGSMPAALAAWRVWSIRSPGVLDCGPEIALGGLTGAGGAGVVGETASVGGGVCAGCVVLGLSSLSICSCAQFWPACVMSLEGVGACGTGACGAPGIVPMAGVGVTGGAGCTATVQVRVWVSEPAAPRAAVKAAPLVVVQPVPRRR